MIPPTSTTLQNISPSWLLTYNCIRPPNRTAVYITSRRCCYRTSHWIDTYLPTCPLKTSQSETPNSRAYTTLNAHTQWNNFNMRHILESCASTEQNSKFTLELGRQQHCRSRDYVIVSKCSQNGDFLHQIYLTHGPRSITRHNAWAVRSYFILLNYL
jgi:hypothetical protein